MKEILLSSSLLILVILLIRLLFRRTISRRVQYALWGLALLRLLLPFSVGTSAWNVASAMQEARDTRTWETASRVYESRVPRMSYTRAYAQAVEEARNAGEDLSAFSSRELDYRAYVRMTSGLTVGDALRLMWYVGMGFMALLFLLANLRFARKLRRTRVPLDGAGSKYPVCLCDDIPSPCLFGLWKPAIYVTSAAAKDPDILRYVLAHEEAHARRLDPLWSLLRSICLVVWWFDPLVWLAAHFSRLDGELACDESVLAGLGDDERIPYGEALLRLVPLGRGSSPMLNATTMTAGKRQMKDRIKRIAEHKKPLAAALVIVLVLAAVVCACTFTGAKKEEAPEPAETGLPSAAGETAMGRYESPEAYLTFLCDHPARRYDGEGWYIYIPIAAWEKREGEDKWVSRYRTGSGISIRETTKEYMEEKREKTAPGQEERYVEGADGRFWLVFLQFDPESITDSPGIRDEPRLLEAMMESFTAPGGREVLRRSWLHTIPPTLAERMGEAADRIFGAYDAPGTGYFLAVEAEGERREYAVDREYIMRGDTLSTGNWLQKAYFWTPLTEEEIAALDRDPGHGPILTAWNETDRFTVYALSDVLCWTEFRDGAEHWLRPSGSAVSLYAFFLSDARIGEMYRPEAVITVPGSVTDYNEAALQMAEQYGAILMGLPAWYSTPPYNLALLSTEVFDAYYGEDYPNFCFNMTFALKLDEQNRDHFEAGAGLRDPIAEGPYAGWYRWGGEVIAALEDGLWRFKSLNTGGSAVWLP